MVPDKDSPLHPSLGPEALASGGRTAPGPCSVPGSARGTFSHLACLGPGQGRSLSSPLQGGSPPSPGLRFSSLGSWRPSAYPQGRVLPAVGLHSQGCTQMATCGSWYSTRLLFVLGSVQELHGFDLGCRAPQFHDGGNVPSEAWKVLASRLPSHFALRLLRFH